MGTGPRCPLARASRPSPLWGRTPLLARLMRGLPEFHLATVIRRLSNGIDQTMQVDRGLEGRLMTFPVTDCLSEQRVHLTDIAGFA